MSVSKTIYKVVFLNDMMFIQERNFDVQSEANTFAGTINTWAKVLKIKTDHTITDVTPSP